MSDLETIVLPDSITEIDEKAFYNCTSLKSFTIPKNVKTLGGYILSKCSSLTTITTELSSNYAVADFFSFTKGYYDSSLTFPSSLSTIIITKGNVIPKKFFSCIPSTITKIDFAEAIIEVQEEAFSSAECGLILPSTVKKIGAYAYSYLGNIGDTITLHEGLEEIGDFAFSDTYFKTINLPSTLTKVGRGVFSNMNQHNTTLKTINMNGTKNKWLSIVQTGYDSWDFGLSYGYKIYCTDAIYTSSLYSNECIWTDR
jgi:hypothetical protein